MRLVYRALFVITAASIIACQSEDDSSVIPDPLVAAFTASDTVVLEGASITFTDQSTGIDSTAEYQWVFEGGIPESFEGPTPPAVAYEDTGRYLVALQVTRTPTNSDSKELSSETKHVTVQLDSSVFCASNPFAPGCTVPVSSDNGEVEDNITRANEVNVYEVQVNSAGVLEVTVVDIPGNLSLEVNVQDSQGNPVGKRTVETDAGRIFYEQLVRPDTYYVVVKDRGSSVSNEDYKITVNLDRDDTNEWNGVASEEVATPLAINGSTTGTLRTDDDEDFFILNIDQFGVLDIRLTSIPEVETGVALLNSNGEELTGTNQFERDKGDPAQLLHLISELGTYYIRLVGDVSSKDTYTLSTTLDTRDTYEYNDRKNAASIELDEDVRGTLRTEGDTDWFEITIDQPGTLIANATTVDDSTDLRLFLYRPTDDDPIADDALSFSLRNAGEPRSLYYLAAPGTYLMRLSNADAGGGGYDLYTLNVSLNTDDPNELNNDRSSPPAASLGQDINGTISLYQDEDWFALELQPGTARVTVTGVDGALDLEAFLYPETSDRNLPRSGSTFDNGNSIGEGEPIDITYDIPAAGTYHLLLRSRSQSVALRNTALSQTVYTLRIE